MLVSLGRKQTLRLGACASEQRPRFGCCCRPRGCSVKRNSADRGLGFARRSLVVTASVPAGHVRMPAAVAVSVSVMAVSVVAAPVAAVVRARSEAKANAQAETYA